MTRELVKPSKALKSATSAIRATQDKIDRAREIHHQTIHRANAEYYQRVRDAIAEESETDTAAEVAKPQDGQQPPTASPAVA